MTWTTPDLCDAHPDTVRVTTGLHWQHFGGLQRFSGQIETVKCFEDNSWVKETLAEPGDGRVLVVDGGGSLRHALIGDQIAAGALSQGWAGIVLHGACRDVEILETLDFGVLALGAVPVKSVRRGDGQRGVPIGFGNVTFESGEWIYVDCNGVVVASNELGVISQ